MLDVHVPRALAEGLRLRRVDVLTAQEDGAHRLSDQELLDRAAATGRACSPEMRACWWRRRRASEKSARLPGSSIGQCIRDLELIALAADPPDLIDRVEYLPLG